MNGVDADVVAAVQERGDRGLVDGAYRLARLARAWMLRDRQYACEPERGVAAELGIDEMVGDDTRLVRAVADALRRAPPERGSVFNLQQNIFVAHTLV